MATPECVITDGAFNCSNVFEGVNMSATVLQATLALVIMLVSTIGNILLILAIGVYRPRLETALCVSISILFTNTAVSILLNGSVFLTSIARNWLFSSTGCKVFAFIQNVGCFSRDHIVGLLSVERFIKEYFPAVYDQYKKKTLASALTVAWTGTILTSIIFYGLDLASFDVAHPTCLFDMYLLNLDARRTITVMMVLLYTNFIGGILPFALYTAVYLKRRSLKKIFPVTNRNRTHSSDPATIEVQMQSKRATFTLFLLMITFGLFEMLFVIMIIAKPALYTSNMGPTTRLMILFLLSTAYRSYVIADLGVMLANQDIRRVFVKLMKLPYKKLRFKK